MFAGYTHMFESGILCSTWLGGTVGRDAVPCMAPPELGGMVAAVPS